MAASPVTYFFHGQTADQANKLAGSPTATFSTALVTNTQAVQQVAQNPNHAVAENSLSNYWVAPVSSTTVFTNDCATFQFYLSTTNAEGLALGVAAYVTVFGDVPGVNSSNPKVLGETLKTFHVGAQPQLFTADLPVTGTITTNWVVQLAPQFVDSGPGLTVAYDGLATPSNFVIPSSGCVNQSATVTFDNTTTVAYAPATIVSPTFLGAEPQTTLERTLPISQNGATDPNRIFVDWPLSTRTQIGQLHRSVDGGDSFRMLLDLSCAIRSRPNCLTGGGGDTVNRVNLYDGTVLYGDQEGVVNEALASSIDHGDTFPTARQFAVSNAAIGVDREWIAPVNAPGVMGGDGVAPGTEVRGFYSYHIPLAGEYIQGIDTNGMPIPQPVTQLTLVNQSGPSRVDVIPGSHGNGYVYQSYRDGNGFEVGVARIDHYQLPGAWSVHNVSPDTPLVFPWINLDDQGNLYAVWVTSSGNLFYSYSLINDPANDPTATPTGGSPGSKWTPKVQINPPNIKSTVFPEIVAGDPGRVAVAYYGTEDFAGQSDNAPDATRWNVYTAVMTNGIDPNSITVATGKVNHRIAHLGNICTQGTTCTSPLDRSLLDMTDLGFDQDGRVGVVFMDNQSTFAGTTGVKQSPFVHFAKEVQGPSLLSSSPSVNVVIPTITRPDPSGDATWPNVAGAANLPGLDELGATVGTDTSGANIVGTIQLNQGTVTAMQSALAAYNTANGAAGLGNDAQRVQYVLRFSTATDVYYLSMDLTATGSPRFFGGKLDSSDALTNGSSTLGAGYHTKTGTTVTGSVDPLTNTINFSTAANTADFAGVGSGTPVFSVTGFAMAGPLETTDTTILDTMRTVDATPPFDTVLQPNGGVIPEARSTPLLVLMGLALLGIVGTYRRRRGRRQAEAG